MLRGASRAACRAFRTAAGVSGAGAGTASPAAGQRAASSARPSPALLPLRFAAVAAFAAAGTTVAMASGGEGIPAVEAGAEAPVPPPVTSPNAERTFIMVKPDGVQRGHVAEILRRFETRGFKLVGIKVLVPPESLASRHYAEHEGKPFFPKLVKFLSSGPVVAMAWEGRDAVATGRVMIGASDPIKSAPGTIRADLGLDLGRNVVHGSDSIESGVRELELWFNAEELADYRPTNAEWVHEPKL